MEVRRALTELAPAARGRGGFVLRGLAQPATVGEKQRALVDGGAIRLAPVDFWANERLARSWLPAPELLQRFAGWGRFCPQSADMWDRCVRLQA